MNKIIQNLFLLFLLVAVKQVNATAIQSTGAGGSWNNPASWSPAQVPVAGDAVTINSGSPITVTANATCATVSINSSALLTLNGGNLTVTGTFLMNGSFDCRSTYVLNGPGSFNLPTGATGLLIGNPYGITTGSGTGATAGSIQVTGGRSYAMGTSYTYDGITNQVTGNGLPFVVNNGGIVTIANTGPAFNNTVTLSTSPSTFQNLTLASGNFSLNSETLTISGGTLLNTGGNLASASSGGVNADGGSIVASGATITGPTNFYNLNLSSNNTITTSGLSSPIIDGTFTIGPGKLVGTNSPRYAIGSTLTYNGPNNRGLEWNVDLSTPATIGVTQGYPDNVTITSGSDFDICNYAVNGNDGAIPRGLYGNLTTSEFTMIDWIDYNNSSGPYYHNPLLLQTGSFTVGGNMIVNAGGNINMALIGGSGAVTIKGSLTINGAGANVDLDSMTNVFSVGNGITLNNGTINVGYTGVASKLQVTGDVVQNGGTINDQSGVFSLTGNFTKTGGTFNALGGTMEFNSTIGSQTFSTNSASETFNNLVVDESAGNLTLLNNLNLTGDLTLTNGLILTGANTLAMTNGSSNVFRTNGWVEGFVQRNISTVGKAYIFPIGDATHYTPVTLTFGSVTTPGDVKVSTYTPFTGIAGYATYALSKTKYVDRVWTIYKSSGTFGTYTGTFDYGTTNLVGGATVGNLHAGFYDGSAWSYPSATGAGTAVTATSITPLGAAVSYVGLSECAYPLVHNITGGGAYCNGGTGVVVGLDNSEAGVNYQLQVGGVNTGAVVAGTGVAISFGNQTATGTYTVNAANAATGCPTAMNGSVSVTVNPLPVITFTAQPGASACLNNNVTYTTQAGESNYIWVIPGTNGVDYTIISGGTTTDNTITLQWLTSGSKTVTINYTDANVCSAATPTSSIATTISAPPAPTFTTVPAPPTCTGISVTYTTQTGMTNYIWTIPGIAGTDYTIISGGTSTDNAVTLKWLTTGNKTVTVNYSNGGGCAGTTPASTTTIVSAGLNPTLASSPLNSSCMGSNVSYTTESGMSNYMWTIPGTNGIDYTIVSGGTTTDNTLTVTWLTAGSKTVQVNYSNPVGCTPGAAASATITVNSLATPTFAQVGPLCINSVASPLSATSINAISGSWNPVAPNTSATGTYHFTFTPGVGQCAVPASMDIVVIDTPLVYGYGNELYLIQQGQSVIVQGTVADLSNVSIAWTPNDNTINNTTIPNPTVSPLASKEYTMVVSSNLVQNCQSSVMISVIVQYAPGIPSAFSPNADGIHDTWYIKNIEQYPDAEVEIFNRYGQVVYQVQGNYLESAWDGTFNGKPLPVGTYYYIINLNNGQAPLTGPVSVIR
jgi:gliding motility-associated-like protein